MTSTPKKTQNSKKPQILDDQKEEPIPFLVYNSNTRSNSLIYIIINY